jgi:signal transduction histidine kinase
MGDGRPNSVATSHSEFGYERRGGHQPFRGRGPDGGRTLLLTTRVNPDAILLTVANSGSPVDPEVVEKMFQPFFTTKPSGMGMGLAICKTIIEAHGGSLTAKPRAHGGMEFQVTLPRMT